MNRKITFLIGSLIGSAVGLLFARESGKDLRGRILKAKTPQEKFEMLFQEYLKVGKNAFQVIEDSDTARDIARGGKDIVAQLKKHAGSGTEAAQFAQEKALELIAEAERRIAPIIHTVAKTAKKIGAKKTSSAKKPAAKKSAAPKKKGVRSAKN